MVDIQKKIAQKTLMVLKKKSWDKLTIDEILKNENNKNIKIKSKIDLLKNINRYVDKSLMVNFHLQIHL